MWFAGCDGKIRISFVPGRLSHQTGSTDYEVPAAVERLRQVYNEGRTGHQGTEGKSLVNLLLGKPACMNPLN